jgi:ATP/maltotriose-dependent transcriptional regulator MalT
MPGIRAPDLVIGRERELAAVERLLATDEQELRALVFEGEPGIGKTTLWQAAVAAAPGRVLSCRPAEAETKLSYASVADLVGRIVDDELPSLPEPQRVAVDVALLRASSGGPPPDRRAVATGVHSVLRAAAAAAPLVLAIDDVQWLDAASAAVLAFALRRLADVAVRVVLTVRVAGGLAPDPLDLERTLPGRVERVPLAPLSLSGLHHMIRERLGVTFPRPTLTRIAQASGGNPLFALELARALTEVEAQPVPGEPLPVPDTLAALMATRIARLPAAAREALLAAACLSTPTVDEVAAVGGGGASLEPAQRADVVAIDDEGRIRFMHPLLASTVYSSASVARRRAMHAALAEVVPELEERARHLALAVDRPDERVAAQLSGAARAADRQASPHAAVELAELALRLTEPDDDEARARRSFELAEHLFRAGDAAGCRRLLEELVDEMPHGALRARALELLARTLHVGGTAAEAVRRCEEALADAADDAALRARIHATFARVEYDDFDLARRHARAALDLLETMDEPDPEVLGQALCAEVGVRFTAGEPLPLDLVERALELERIAPAPDVADRMSAALGVWLKVDGDFENARRWLEVTYRTAVDEGDDASLPYALSHLPQLEIWTGHWTEAERRAREHLELAEETGQIDQRRQALYNLAYVLAHLGRVDAARAAADELLAEGEAAGDVWSTANALAVLGFLELSLGNPATAADVLRRNLELRDAIGTDEPLRAQSELAQALVELGDVDEAAGVVSSFETRVRRSGRRPLLALAAAARARLAAARGDLDGASAALDEAIAEHERTPVPFDRARTLLVLGQVQRRRGERRAARATLQQAQSVFEELGAPLWAERAAAEARRVPIRRGAAEDLTPTEEQVALLAASGRTNRDVAQTLFMSPKTVEANLTRIYRKLGIGSRAELGAAMAERTRGASAPKP